MATSATPDEALVLTGNLDGLSCLFAMRALSEGSPEPSERAVLSSISLSPQSTEIGLVVMLADSSVCVDEVQEDAVGCADLDNRRTEMRCLSSCKESPGKRH